MNTRKVALLTLSAGLLGGCSMNGPNNYEVHEALLYGSTQERIGWVYGTLGGNETNVKLGDQTLTLRPQVQDALSVPGSLSVNGKATFRAPTTSAPRRITVTRDSANAFTVQASGNVDAVYVTDGQSWSKLTGSLKAGDMTRVPPQNNAGLRGAGKLTDVEADALGRALLGQGPLAVAVIPEAEIPDKPLAAQPAPKAYLRTGLYIQSGVTTTATSAPATPPATPTPNRPTMTNINAQVIERGSNSTYGQNTPQVMLARSPAEFASAWRLASGNLVPTPPAPNVNFSGNTVVTFFLGQRPTGGYGVRFVSAAATGSTATITVETTTPGPGTITTQALTSPWVAVQLAGSYDQVVVQDTTGRVLAQSR